MTSQQLREKFLKFFQSKNHTIISSASLVPRQENQSALFTTAGMHPLVPYLLGEKHQGGNRIAGIQKCIRTVDIDDVGDNRHLTFFEMMGNWSFGDYFKREAIEWSFEFLTGKEWLNLDPKRIYVTVFKGENEIPRDEETIEIWKKIFKEMAGIDVSVAKDDEMIKNNIRIIPLGAEDNFWIAGKSGPCGSDTEMFYDTSPEDGLAKGKFSDLVKNFRLIEIWNNVFMEYEKSEKEKAKSEKENADKEYEYIKLKQQNVDTGMGLERTLAALNGKKTVFETDIFEPIFAKISEMSGKKYDENAETKRSFRIIADHIKASSFIVSDGIFPSNIGRGYILRRLIRRAMRYGRALGLADDFHASIVKEVVNIYKNQYPDLADNESQITDIIGKELQKFGRTLKRGLKEFEKLSAMMTDRLPGKIVFDLYQTYGFPIEMVRELSAENGLSIDEEGFKKELEKHQEISRVGAEKKFGGHGLKTQNEKIKVPSSEEIEKRKRLHTATHLLHQALRIVLGLTVRQMGSDINQERLRFDFSFDRKMTKEELTQTEELVNKQIKDGLAVKKEEMPYEEAVRSGALAFFKDKYPERVIVHSMGGFSKEICGGPHTENTAELGKFKIQKEEASSTGVRRIKAVLE